MTCALQCIVTETTAWKMFCLFSGQYPALLQVDFLYGVCFVNIVRFRSDTMTWLPAIGKANRIFRGADAEPTKHCLNPQVGFWNRSCLAVWGVHGVWMLPGSWLLTVWEAAPAPGSHSCWRSYLQHTHLRTQNRSWVQSAPPTGSSSTNTWPPS